MEPVPATNEVLVLTPSGGARAGGRRTEPRGVSSENVRTAALAVIAVVIGLAALQQARLFVIPTLLAGLLALALAPLARRLERIGLPAVVAAFLLVFGSIGGIGFGAYMVAPSAEALRAQAPSMLRKIERIVRQVQDEVQENVPLPAPAPAPPPPPTSRPEPEPASAEPTLVESGRALLADMALSAPATVGATLYGAFLAFFLLAERAAIPRFVLALAPSWRARLMLGRAMREMRVQVSSYLFAVSLINAGLGVAVGFAFWAIGMPSPAIWGVAAAILNYVPYLGSLVLNVAALAVAIVTFPTIESALLALAALVSLNAIEANLVTPALVGRRVEVGALAVFVAVAFGAWLWGAAGALMATPALLVVRAFAQQAVKLRPASRRDSRRRVYVR